MSKPENELDNELWDALMENVSERDLIGPSTEKQFKNVKALILSKQRALLETVEERVIDNDESGETNVMIAMEHVRQRKALNNLKSELGES